MPHSMKKVIFCIIAIVLTVFCACKKKEEPQSSPRIYMSYFLVHHNGSSGIADTLAVRTIGDHYAVDTISVGDTVQVAILLNAVTNRLTNFVLETDTNYLKYSFSLYKELQAALTADSDTEHGKFVFKSGYSAATIPMEYISRKSGKPTVTMTVCSDSEFSPSKLVFDQLIR